MARVPASRRMVILALAVFLAVSPGPAAAARPAIGSAHASEAAAAPVEDPVHPTSSTAVVVKVPGPNEVYRFGPDMTSRERAKVKEWVAYGVALQERMLGRKFTRFTILASKDARWLAQEDCKTRPPGMQDCVAQQTKVYEGSLMGGCYPAPEQVACSVIASLSVRGLNTDAFRGCQFAHEAHHVFHGQVYPDAWRATQVPPTQVWSTGPVWLLEGAANYICWRVQFQRGLTTYAKERKEWVYWSRKIRLPLQRLETLAVSDRTLNAYHLYSLALDELMKIAPKKARSLTAYYAATAQGTPWKTAFKQAFGISVESFYKRFAKVRAGL